MALAEGTSTLPPDHLPFLDNFKVTFWFPDTVGSFDACKSFAKKIGEDKCRTITKDIPQPSVALKKWDPKLYLRVALCKGNSFLNNFSRLHFDIGKL